MKNTLTVLSIFLLFSCNTNSSDSTDFDWLIGNWQQTNTDDTYHETWEKESQGKYNGNAVVMNGSDTIFQEIITLVQVGNKWELQVIQPGESEPTRFDLSTITPSSFTCENPENEFPKQIYYQETDTGISATISDAERKIDFEFSPR